MASTNDDSLRITSGSMAAAKKKDENFVPTGGMGQLVYRGDAGSNENKVGNIYMPAPYAVIVEPRNEGGNVTQGDKNYTATYNAYKAAASRLVDQTDEAANLKAAWSVPPKVSINNGNLELSGTSAFLKSNEAKQLRETLQGMKGKTYNTEDLNKQVEAWNSTFQRMSEQYLDTVDAMNQANSAIAESAGNAKYHKLTFSDMQKIGNSATVGKSPEARTSSTKIFVGFDWDKNGKQIEKWVEAKKFFEEFNSMDDDKKRSAYRDLITRSNNGDVGAYSKLMYLNGGSQGKPANVDYDAVGDFFHTMGVNLLTGLAEAADFVTTYVPVFNTARLTGRIVSAANSGDINDFFKSDDIRNMVDDYEEAVNWENAYFSQLTPGSTQAAAITGSVVGNVLGMAYSIWAGGVGNAAGLAVANAATQPIKLAIASANQSLVNSGKFVAFSRSTVTGAQGAMGGAVRTAGSVSNRFLIPTAIVEKFPNFSSALADTALKFSEMSGIGNTGATAAQALSGSEKAVTLVTNTVGAGAKVVSKTSMVTLAGKTLAQERAIATGIQTAFRLAPLAGEVALRHTDQYFQKLNAGEEVGELSDYVFENTVKDMAWGAAFMAAGAGLRKLKDVARAAKKSPADAASAASYASENTQQGFYNDSHFTYDRGSNYLPSGLERTQDFQEFVSTIMTVNGEGIYAVPNSSAPMTVSAVPGTDVAQEAGKVFGAVSKNVIKQYEVEPVPDGANVVETATNLDGTKTISKQHFDSLDEANDAVRGKTVPTTSPKTLANNDQVADIKVAPLTINGVAPEVLPKGVTQIKFEPGVVYRTPDDLVDELVSIAAKEGWHTDNQDRLYREYEQYQKEVEAQQGAIETIGEAPALPKEMWGTDIEGVLRTAAWAKVRGYNAIPLRVPTSYSRTIKKFSMRDKFISKLADKYEFPEISPEDMLKGENSLEVNDELFRTNVTDAGALVYALDNGVTRSDFYLPTRSTNFSDMAPRLDNILAKEDNELLRALGAAYAFAGKYYNLVYYGLDPHKVAGDVTTENVEALLESAGLHVLKTNGVNTFAVKPVHKIIEHCETKEQALEVLTYIMKEGFDLWARGQWLDNMFDGADAYKPAKQVVEESDKAIEKYAKILVDRLYARIKSSNISNVSDGITNELEAVISPALDKYVDTALENATGLSSAIRVPVSKVGDKLIYRPEASTEDAVIAHIPAGTKVVSYEPFGSAPKGARKYGHISGFIFDASEGVREKDGELYVNTYGGAEYTPATREYTQSDYAIYGENDSAEGYKKLGKEMLAPMRNLQDQRGEVFVMVEPGGNINAMNRMLREYGYNNLPRDTIKTRTDYAREFLDEVFRSGGQKGKDGRILYRIDTVWYPDSPRNIDSLISQVKQHIYHRYEDFKTQGSRINKLEKVWSLMNNAHGDGWLSETNAILKAKATGLSKEELKAGLDFFDEVRMGLEDIEDKYQDIYIKSPKDYDPEALRSDLLEFLDSLDKKYSKRLPADKNKDLSDRMRLVDTWGRKGSHKVSLPEGTNYLWTFRGANESGNQVNNSWNNRNMAEHMSGWEVGGHYNTSSLDFHSMNAATPFHYSEGVGDNIGDEYIIATAHPNGTGVFYYGDPEKFGDRIHYADGGAIVTPYGEGFTVVSIRNLGKDAAGKDVKLIITVRDNADGTPYSGPIDGQGGGIEKITERVRADETEITPNNIVGMQYGVPYEYFANESDALAWAKEEGSRAVHRLDDNADILTRPPVTTDDLAENPLLLGAGEGYIPHVERFDELMTALPTLMEEGEGAVDYLRGIVDIAREVNTVYTAVAANVNLDDIYSRYAKAIYDGEEVSLTPDEKKALEPITHMLDALGHYFDPSGKSLTQEFYLPTALATNKMVSIEKALLKGEEVDLEHPVDTGFNDILLDLQRIGDAGFWQKRTGDLFRDEDGNFTMARAGTLQNALTSYTVSALTRGKNGLAVAVNNEVAKSKYDRNRSQITEKQAYAGIKEADKIRGKTKSYRAAISKDADKIAELKEDYDESAVDQAMKAKNYSKDLGFVKSTNHAAQLLGYNQFLEMTPIQGSVIRYGTQGQVYRGTTNIRRKMEKINITGPMWVTRFGAKQRIGFGLEASEANTKKYGVFKAGEPAVNLGRIVSMNFDSDTNALAYLYTLKGVIKSWSTGDGMDMVTAVNKYARENFPLLDDYEWDAAKLLKELARNYHASADPMAVDAMNVDSISKWIRDCTATCFNNAIMMTDISNLDERTLEALDETAAYIYVGSPLKRNKVINTVLRWESVAKLGVNVSPVLGNIVSEIFTRLPGYIGWKDTTRALKRALDVKEAARIRNIISDLPSHYDSPEDDTMLQTAKKLFGTFTDKATDSALKLLTWSESVKNLVYYAAGEINAERKGITDPAKKQIEAIRFVGEHAIAGGRGTAPGIAESSLGRTLFLFRTFTIRNFDDFIDFVEKASRGETGDNYWDAKYEKKYGKNNKDRSGRNKASFKLGAKAVGGRLMRSYVIWLTILAYFGKSLPDALGGDPTGITDGGKDRGLYDDEDTDEYEGMTDFDNFINGLPAGVIFGSLQDLYFAARRRGVDSKQFMAFDLWNDQKLNNDMSKHLPLGVAYNRFADMLDLLDRGYSFSSTGKKTYAAPETALDVVKGFLFGKSTTENSLAYGKYRYGTVNIWGDLSSGDWMDFAMNANPISGNAEFDTTRKDYTGVFNGSWNDISTMQLIIQRFKERQQTIIDEFNRDKYRYGGEWDGLTDEQKVAKAKEIRSKKINEYTEDVVRAVEAFTNAGNALSDKQITTMMYLFDFHEGEEDDEWNSSYARERYVEAGLPDYDAAGIQRKEQKNNGKTSEETRNILDRSLVLQNAQQGFYGSSKEAANAMKDVLKDFNSTYKEYNARVKALNEKYFAARKKNKKSAEVKQLSTEIEKVQNEYLDKLYAKLSPVIERYGTALVGTYDGADVLEDYMGNMIPYSSIKKYGQTFSSGNDIVYGQLTEWLQKRYGRNAPTAPSDKEVTNGITEIKKLLDQGKTATAKSRARAILEKIGRGSLGARRDDVETLRSYVYD